MKKTVSAAMIVKNESRCIVRCLESIVPAVDEIIVVDTGSTDGTREILTEFAAIHPTVKVFDFVWCDDFSAARNYSIDQVTSDWVLIMDADEFLFDEDIMKVRMAAQQFDVSSEGLDLDHISVFSDETFSREYVLRMFPSFIRYTGIIHEDILYPFSKRIGIDIRIIHDGYNETLVDPLEKMKRNLNLLNKALQDDPYNARNLMYFGLEIIKYDLQKGLNFLERAKVAANGDRNMLDLIDLRLSKVWIVDK
jgi:glycosyltransferase involved in cell wall biosynthesis